MEEDRGLVEDRAWVGKETPEAGKETPEAAKETPEGGGNWDRGGRNGGGAGKNPGVETTEGQRIWVGRTRWW